MKRKIEIMLAFFLLLLTVGLVPDDKACAAAASLADDTVTLSKKSFYYTGSACEPKVTVQYGGKTLTEGSDYTVAYSGNINPGKAYVTVTGKGDYTGTVKVAFTIKNALKVTLAEDSYVYSGLENKPAVTVKKGSKKLAAGCYTVTYEKNINAGTAAVIVTGCGKYAGKNARVTFKITAAPLTDCTLSLSKSSYTYTASACKPKTTVKTAAGSKLKKGTDYTVKYKNNVKVGTATVTVTGKGNYSGSLKKTFKIKAAGLALDYSSVVIAGDQTAKLNVSNSSGNVTWTSSDDNIVHVDGEGNISGGSAGTATITATDSKGSASCKVSVVRYDFIPVTMTLSEGQTQSFEVIEAGPAQNYTFESEDTDLVIVDSASRTVTAVGTTSGTTKVNLCVNTTFGVKKYAFYVTVEADSMLTATFPNTRYATASGTTDKTIVSQATSDLSLIEDADNACSDDEYYQPRAIATVYRNGYNYYFVADTWNNRVIVYRTAENEVWGKSEHGVSDNVYCVLGQKNMTSRESGYTLDKMNWPVCVTAAVVDGKIRIFVADTNNDRILVWNDLPDKNGAAADYSLMELCDPTEVKYGGDCMLNYTDNRINWPWAVWTDGEKLICAATRSGKIIIWDSLPTATDKYADKLIQMNGTPRSISYRDGYLVVGDHNAIIDGVVQPGVHLYNDITKLSYSNIVSRNDPSKTLLQYVEYDGDVLYKEDGTYPTSLILDREVTTSTGDTLPEGTLLLLMSSRISVWKDGRVDSASDKPDYYIGGGVLYDTSIYMFLDCDYPGMVLDHNDNLYVVMGSYSLVVGYENGNIPGEPGDLTSAEIKAQSGDAFSYNGAYYFNKPDYGLMKFTTQEPDLCIGAETTLTADGQETNMNDINIRNSVCNIDTDSKYLVGCGLGSNYIYIWKSIPDTNKANPDTIIASAGETIAIYDVQLFEYEGRTGLIAGGLRHIFVWYDIEDAIVGKKYDLIYNGTIGTRQINNVQAVAYTDGYLLVANGDHEFMIFKGFPTMNDSPVRICDITVQTLHATKVASDNRIYLGVGAGDGYGRIYLLDQLLDGVTAPEYVLKGAVRSWINTENGLTESKCGFNVAKEVLVLENGAVAVTDQGFARVVIWKTIKDAVDEGNQQDFACVASPNRIVIGRGEGTSEYTNADVLKADPTNIGSVSVNDPIPIDAPDCFFMPSGIAYDGVYLWVSDFKFSGGVKRFTGKIFAD